MARQQLLLGSKVKLELVQPPIKCSGREDVRCFYRGKVEQVVDNEFVYIGFKYKGNYRKSLYSLFSGRFLDWEIKDIRIVE